MFGVFIQLQLKRTFRHLPLILAGAMLLFLLTGSIAFLSSQKLYGDAITGRMNFGVVYPGQADSERLFIRALGDQATLKNMMEFKETTESQGRMDLEQGKIQALLILPEGFVNKVLTGVNTPAKIILNRNQVLEARLLETLAEAGASTLSASQGALYAAFEVYTSHGAGEPQKLAMNQAVNDRYLKLALGRDKSFHQETVRATEELDSLTYFLSSWMILFLLLLGMPEAFVMRPLSKGMTAKLEIEGIGAAARIFADWLRLFLLQFLITALLMAVWYFAAPFLGISWTASPVLMAGAAAISFAVAGFILLIYSQSRELLSGMLILFALSFIMVFASGGFLPIAFLPAILRSLSNAIPTTGWIQVMGGLLTGSLPMDAVLRTLIWGSLFIILAWVSEIIRQKRGELQ